MSATPEELPPVQSVLIPTEVLGLLVPSTSVAEVTGITVLTPISPAHESVMGVFEWRGVRVPVISFEILCGQSVPRPRQRSKIAIFYPLAGRPRLDFFAILASADPQSRLVSRDQIEEGAVDAPDTPYIARAFSLRDQPVAIPDLKAIRGAFSVG
jgi:chemosensory pili system protein ChpC